MFIALFPKYDVLIFFLILFNTSGFSSAAFFNSDIISGLFNCVNNSCGLIVDRSIVIFLFDLVVFMCLVILLLKFFQ
jgi:hypothetical protein